VTWLLVAVVVLGLPLLGLLADLALLDARRAQAAAEAALRRAMEPPIPCSTSSTPATEIRQGSVRSRPIPVGHRAGSQVEADLLGRRPAPATIRPGPWPPPQGLAAQRRR
jgi:hypothetical protein